MCVQRERKMERKRQRDTEKQRKMRMLPQIAKKTAQW